MRELDPRVVLTEFEGVRLGDERLDRRLQRVLSKVSAAPSDSFPEQMESDADQEALYRFLNNEKVTVDALLEGHRKQTIARMRDCQLVRIVHDTTELSFEGQREGLGYLGGNTQGFLAHVALALTADDGRTPLGVLGVRTFINDRKLAKLTRSQKVTHYLKEPRAKKQSSRWEKLAFDVVKDLPDGVQALHVMDQEADDYSVFSALLYGKARFVIRVEASRLDAEKVPADLVLSQDPAKLLRKIQLSRRTKKQASRQHPERSERLAELHVRTGSVTLRRPPSAHEAELSKLTVQALHVFEPSPPGGVEPIEWMLFTSEPVGSEQEIEAVVDHYRARWVIEEYFKALKTGCAIEKRQLTSFDGLTRALALFVPMAWLLLSLRSVARDQPNRDGQLLMTPDQLVLLRALLEKRQKRLAPKPTVRDVMLGVAALGGHIKNNGDPGWIVLGRGLRRFCEAEEVWSLMRERCDQS